MDVAFTCAVSQLLDGPGNSLSVNGTRTLETSMKRRVRNGALGLAALAAVFYFGFIALLVYRSHH